MKNKYKDSVIDEFIESVAPEIPCWRCLVDPQGWGDCKESDCAKAIKRKLQELSE